MGYIPLAERTKFYVDQKKFDAIDKLYAAMKISEGKSVQTFHHLNDEWVYHSGMSNRSKNFAQHYATRVVDLVNYKGDLKPLPYSQHWQEVDKGNRDRSYTGMLIKSGQRQLVFIGDECIFEVGNYTVGQQLSLF